MRAPFSDYNTYIHGNVTKTKCLKQTKMSSFFFYKIREQEGRTDPVGGGQ
jgi:hypothetical protein